MIAYRHLPVMIRVASKPVHAAQGLFIVPYLDKVYVLREGAKSYEQTILRLLTWYSTPVAVYI